MAKSTRSETMQRVEQVMLIMLDGGELHDIREFAKSTGEGKTPWNVSTSSLRRYMEKAWKLIERSREKDRGKLFARHIQSRRRMQAKALEQGDIRAAHALARDIAELEGMYPQKKEKPKEASTRGRIEEMMSSPELRQLLRDSEDWTPPTLQISPPNQEERKA